MSTALIRSDLLRLRTVPAPLAGVAAVMLLALLIVTAATATVPREAIGELTDVLTVPSSLTAMALLILGALGGTSDFQHRTADATFLARPRRGQVLASRALTYAGLGAVAGGLSMLAGALIADAVANARGLELVATMPLTVSVLGSTAAGSLCGALGVGLGFAIRGSVPAVIAVVAWASIGEGIVGLLVPAPLLPVGAARVLGGEPASDFPQWAAAAALTFYVVAALTIGSYRLRHRDIDA
jgi:hypothetical protein